MAERTAQPVQLPDQDRVEGSTVSIGQQAVEFGALCLGPTDALVQVLPDDLEAPRLGVVPKAVELEIQVLVLEWSIGRRWRISCGKYDAFKKV